MLSGRRGDARELGQTYGLFAGALVGFLVVLAILGQYGLADPFIAFLVVAVTLVSFAVIGVLGRTLSEADFYVAGRAVPPVFNGLAIDGGLRLGDRLHRPRRRLLRRRPGGAGSRRRDGGRISPPCGAVAPYFRKSGAVTVPDFLSHPLRRATCRGWSASSRSSSSPFLRSPPPIAGAVFILAKFLAVRSAIALDIAVLTILFSTLLGGMRGVTLVAGAQAIVLLVGLMAPVAILSARDYGVPHPAAHLRLRARRDRRGRRQPGFARQPHSPLPRDELVHACRGRGVARHRHCRLPHLLMRSLSARRVSGARRSLGWALLFVGAVLITAPALAAFAKAAVYRDLVGSAVEDLPDWVFAYGRSGLVKICGVDAVSLAALKTACTGIVGDAGLAAGSIAVSPDIVALAFPDITGFPFVITALIAAGGLAATLGSANAIAITLATAIGRDFYGSLVAPFAPAGRRVIVTRVILIAVVLAAAAVAEHRPDEMFALAAAAPALASAGPLSGAGARHLVAADDHDRGRRRHRRRLRGDRLASSRSRGTAPG